MQKNIKRVIDQTRSDSNKADIVIKEQATDVFKRFSFANERLSQSLQKSLEVEKRESTKMSPEGKKKRVSFSRDESTCSCTV